MQGTPYATDMYLGMYYMSLARRQKNWFTTPFSPPYKGTSGMFGTTTNIATIEELIDAQRVGSHPPVCAWGSTATLTFFRTVYPELQVQPVFFSSDHDLYMLIHSQQCRIILGDAPGMNDLVKRLSLAGKCFDRDNNPIGGIGEPLDAGYAHYGIGVGKHLSRSVVDAFNYWLTALMVNGTLSKYYRLQGIGNGTECGYVLYPSTDSRLLSKPALVGIVVGIVLAVLALWYNTYLRREAMLKDLRAKSAAEKAALIAQNAEETAKKERELNDFIAHEVRNPLAAAMSATNFVASELSGPAPLSNNDALSAVREDLGIVDSSLSFINDLLRTQLDVHRVANKQMKVQLAPTDLHSDILDPITTMLSHRDEAIDIVTECCPDHLMVMTDRVRLKQIILNLSNNARKFVTKGFIRIGANIKDGKVYMYVEDSGPGIPLEKRSNLFDKYQESLDKLNQGTGIGLALCKGLSQLLNGELYLDESYNSGIEGFLGTRFVIDLNAPPLELGSQALDQYEKGTSVGHTRKQHESEPTVSLPEKLKILFVDDDVILRKLFARSVKRVAPGWEIQDASNGETALCMVEAEEFDVIFLDQYLASVEKQLLGSETARALRGKGVKSIICGLSANDVEAVFAQNGADAFMFKPFPCKQTEMQKELVRVLKSRSETQTQHYIGDEGDNEIYRVVGVGLGHPDSNDGMKEECSQTDNSQTGSSHVATP